MARTKATADKLMERIEAIVKHGDSGLGALERIVTSFERTAKEYRRTHWGKSAREVVFVDAADPSAETALPALGELHSITYETRKGKDKRLILYEHEFHAPKPLLLYSPAQRGKLIIAGGSYKTDERGIIG
jgi:hypothetical protein